MDARNTESDERRFAALFEAAPDAIFLADDQRRYVDANPAALALIGVSREELPNMRVDDLASPAVRPAVPEMWAKFIQDGWLDGGFELETARGPKTFVFRARANFQPGLHLSILRERRVGARLNGERALTPRQAEVMRLLALGLQGPQIAEELVISPETVRTHIDNAIRMLGARTRVQAIAEALTRGEIEL